ncbi:MAG TPA: hypothetical protein VJV78_23530 [Polyangiales bacterium]|nr:hypothetical protein [Polyangiales bacterium]
MGVTQRYVLLLVCAGLLGCQGSNDTVLQPDQTSGTGGGGTPAAGAAAGGGATPAAGSGSGAEGGRGGAGTPAAGSGTGGSGMGQPSGGKGGSTAPSGGKGGGGGTGGTPAAGGGGGGSGGGTEPEAGTGGASGEGGGASGTGGEGGQGGDGNVAQDADCDFNGIWIGKQVTVSLADAFPLPQSSNNWYYLEFKQNGTNVEVSKHFDCGIQVNGSVTVKISKATLTALMQHNVQTGRKATLKKEGGKCVFDGARFWSIRGADETRFLPNDGRDSMESIQQVETAKPLPSRTMTDGAQDTENDSKLGVAFEVMGIVMGTRNSVQRDWTRWFTATGGYEITPSTDWKQDLKIRSEFDNQENVLDPSSGQLTSGSKPSGTAKHILRLRFLGRDKSDPRVSQIVKATDVDTCFAIQDAFPAEEI